MLTDLLKEWSMWAIESGGLLGAGVLMALESMIAPIPSEVVMPPLGMLVHDGKFTWWGAMVGTSLGSLAGSLIGYYMGHVGGKPLVLKVGRVLLLNEHHLDLTTRWFKKWGSLTVFVSRFVPVVRHFISIPAGIAKMNLAKFCLYTLIGASLWNGFLLWVGYVLAEKWEKILQYRKPIDAVIIVSLVVGVVAWYWIHLRKPAKAMSQQVPGEQKA